MATIASGLLPDANGRRPLLEREPYMQHEERMMIAEVLIHHLDVMRFLCGELRVVAARAARTVPDVVGETVAAIFLETGSGAPVEVTGTMVAAGYPARPPDRLEIIGSKASATFADSELRLHGATPRSQSLRFRESVIRRASTASSRISSIASKPARRSRPTPPTISRRCASSSMPTGPPACIACVATPRQSFAVDTRTDLSRSLIGQSKFALDTPALLVDLDVMEANIARIVATCRAHGVAWRPHSKAHKTPEIAQMQIAAGAIGVTCAKLGEAEVMAAAGIRDILIANQIVGPTKIDRLVRLAEQADPIVCVDSIENADRARRGFGTPASALRVAIEVNIGMNRAGVEPGASVAAFAREIAQPPGLALRRRGGLGKPRHDHRRPGREGAHGQRTPSPRSLRSADACAAPATASRS